MKSPPTGEGHIFDEIRIEASCLELIHSETGVFQLAKAEAGIVKLFCIEVAALNSCELKAQAVNMRSAAL